MAEEGQKSTTDRVREGWDNAIEEFSGIDTWERFSSWCGQFAPSLVKRVDRYADHGIRDPYLVKQRVREAFRLFRGGYDSFEANLGIAIAPNSQSFSFETVAEKLYHDK